MQLDIAIDEIFGNIVNYAYTPEVGKVTVRLAVDEKTLTASLTLIDSGVPYNPLEKDDPDTTLSAEDRKIGGLGIFLVKKSMDDMRYEYKDGKNILTLVKSSPDLPPAQTTHDLIPTDRGLFYSASPLLA